MSEFEEEIAKVVDARSEIAFREVNMNTLAGVILTRRNVDEATGVKGDMVAEEHIVEELKEVFSTHRCIYSTSMVVGFSRRPFQWEHF
ncbi:hypothetical protein RUND412_000630 [Rhizina undulata]